MRRPGFDLKAKRQTRLSAHAPAVSPPRKIKNCTNLLIPESDSRCERARRVYTKWQPGGQTWVTPAYTNSRGQSG